jgi:hypothetical protein
MHIYPFPRPVIDNVVPGLEEIVCSNSKTNSTNSFGKSWRGEANQESYSYSDGGTAKKMATGQGKPNKHNVESKKKKKKRSELCHVLSYGTMETAR